jgi:hypothetical protein
MALGAGACDAFSSTAANSVANASSSTASALPPLPPCLVGPVGPGLPINVGGVDCFPSRGGGSSGASGLMTSSCTEGTPACSYCNLVLCDPSGGQRVSYACVCSGGTWSCTVEWRDTGFCWVFDAGAADAEPTDAGNITTDGAVCGPGEVVCALGCGPDTACFGGACPTLPLTICPR